MGFTEQPIIGPIKFKISVRSPYLNEEAQLSQRDHMTVTFRVIEYFAKSFEVNQGHLK